MNIGTQIKKYRKVKKLTLQELSDTIGLSTAFLSNLERNVTSPTLVNLQRICAALDINITALLSDTEAGFPVVRKNERKEIFNINANVNYESMVDGKQAMRGVSMTIHEDYFVEEVSWGHNADEFGVVVKGAIQLELDGTAFVLEEGDSIYIPKNTPHRFKKTSPGTCITYWVLGGHTNSEETP